jgi:hypothetical protein
MMSLTVIRRVNADIAAEAARENRLPYMPWDAEEVERWTRCPLPNLGYYDPTGWERLETSWFVDKTGVGLDWEPALTWKQFRRQLSEYVAENPGHGFGIVEEGEFQCVVAAFRSVDGDAR